MSTAPKKWVPRQRAAAPLQAPRGVHFPSDRTGEPKENERHHRFNPGGRNHALTRAEKAALESRRLARRTIRVKPVKGVLKGTALKGKQTRHHRVHSHSPTRKTAKAKRAHSR
jgi:hypothetical protein